MEDDFEHYFNATARLSEESRQLRIALNDFASFARTSHNGARGAASCYGCALLEKHAALITRRGGEEVAKTKAPSEAELLAMHEDSYWDDPLRGCDKC